MNLFTYTFNCDLRRKLKINRSGRNTFANSGLLLAFTLLLLVIAGSLPKSANGFRIINRDTDPSIGCHHNGTVYGDGSLVPTMEPCLSCKCAHRTLLCSLRVCHDLPVPPPRGCVIVHHKNKCCPHMFCKRFHKRPMISDKDRRIVNFLDEFEQEQQDVHQRYDQFDGGENALRRRSDDPDSFDEFCVQNGTIYQAGSAMTTSSLCSYCYCINGKQKCVKPKCQLPEAPVHCSPVYMEGSCCPLKYDCSGQMGQAPTAINITTTTQKPGKKWTRPKPNGGLSVEDFSNLPHNRKMHSCQLKGRVFFEGEKLPVDPDDPCNICYCIHGESKCTPKKCTPAMKNCVPIIPAGQCCPSGYKCNMPKPRQFDLFSILFGLDENATESTMSGEVTTMPPFVPLSPLTTETTSEKSFLDVLRDGLNYVEKNGDQLESAMDKSMENANETNSRPMDSIDRIDNDSVAVVTVTESASEEYFDYEENDPDDDDLFNLNEKVNKVPQDHASKERVETTSSKPVTTTTTKMTTRIPSSTSTKRTATTTTSTTRTPQTTTPKLEISTIKFIPSPTRVVNLVTKRPITFEGPPSSPTKDNVKQDVPLVSNQMASNSSTESLFSAFFSGLAEILDEKFKQNGTRNGTNTAEFKPTTGRPTMVTKPQFYVTPSSIRPVPIIREVEVKQDPVQLSTKAPAVTTRTTKTTTTTTTKRPTAPTTLRPSSTTPSTTTTTSKPSTTKSTIRTTTPTPITKRSSTTVKPSTTPSTTTRRPETKPTELRIKSTAAYPVKKTTEETFSTQTEKVSLFTPKPLALPPTVLNKPAIVEDSDYHFDYNEPTLPPSLPNLKIIPFLPADAVKHDRKNPSDYYYTLERTSYPSITTDAYEANFGQFEVGEKTIDYSNSYVKEQLSHDIIKKGDGFVKYSSSPEASDKMEDKSDYDYLLDGYNLKKNGYGQDYMKNNFDVDVNSYMSFKSGPVYKNSNTREPVGTAEIATVELRTEPPEFNFDLTRFSPPKETEGGFQPRNPERIYEKYDSTKHIIDITTEQPLLDSTRDSYFPQKTVKGSVVDPNTISITTDRNIPEMKDMPSIIRQSDDLPKDSIPNLNPESDGGLFGDLFSMLFNEKAEGDKTTTPEENFKSKLQASKEQFSDADIPPFKSINPNIDFSQLEMTTKRPQHDLEDPLNVDLVGVTTSYDKGNGTAIKNILLDLLGHGPGSFETHAVTAATKTPTVPPPPQKPLKFPVHSVPYIAANLHINAARPIEPFRNNLDSLFSSTSSSSSHKFGILADDLNTESYVVNPLNLETLKRHQSELPAKIYSKPNKNDLGLQLKLAGCNIYGRMYRVGRIISELSGPCLQCMCEEVGVNCTPLEC